MSDAHLSIILFISTIKQGKLLFINWSTENLNSACTVILRWRLHFEFVTAREPLEPPTVLQNQSEVTVWTGAEHVDVDTFSWDLPIKVLPTNPALASYMSHFTGTNSINIWLYVVCVRLWTWHYEAWILCFWWYLLMFALCECEKCYRGAHFRNKAAFFCCRFYCICTASDGFYMESMQPMFCLFHMRFTVYLNFKCIFPSWTSLSLRSATLSVVALYFCVFI